MQAGDYKLRHEASRGEYSHIEISHPLSAEQARKIQPVSNLEI
jgi:hypothetical protein